MYVKKKYRIQLSVVYENEWLIRQCHIEVSEINGIGLDGFFVQALVVFAVV